MLDQLFGAQLGTMAKFAVAFVLVLGLIGVTALILKRFGTGGMPTSGGGRNRQPRLAVLDSAVVDSKRRLVLIRRDNSEHLLLIGGPTDVVVEANINRAGPVTSAAERRPRGAVAQDLDAPEYAPPPEPEMEMPAPQPAPRAPAPAYRQREVAARPPRPLPEPEPYDDLPLAPTRPEPHVEPAAYAPPPPMPRPTAHPSAAVPPAQPRNEPNYSEMQQKMEAALRNPASPPPARSAHPAPQPRPATAPMPQTRPMPAVSAPKAPPAPAPAPAPAQRQEASNPFDSLEAEMASLLGQDKKS